ncbi:DUF982 domain-containing protein [Mesorhizobium sp. LCM 4577]|uniref:DUF982 domain-containing protein n=1 Tax=Mesorhizobium sp. LCM 4577 TaxID=1848288 RepID=UPI001FCDCB4B|nr:DUF982 domain-containing protein [Mesorhizobium sp. LCM 4577]
MFPLAVAKGTDAPSVNLSPVARGGCVQDQRFETPVRVALGKSGHTIYTVDRVAQAADILLNRWPASPGKKHTAARKACLSALQGLGAVRHARKPSLRPPLRLVS